jgi:hypothetical protein
MMRPSHNIFLYSLLLALLPGPAHPAGLQDTVTSSPRPPLTTEQVVQNLVQMNSRRAQALRAYEGTRTYRLEYHGFPSGRSGEMLVKMSYQAPASKQFTVISQTGSRVILDKVFKKLLAGEQEALQPENQRRTALDPANYTFKLLAYEVQSDGSSYLLEVEPRSHNKFLYRGKIQVDGTDFAVTRIAAEPAKNPSFWIKHTQIEHEYEKVGDFWLPRHDLSLTQVRLGGRAELTIEYTGYKILQAAPLG